MVAATIVRAPEKIPEAPKPATARPMINVVEFRDTAQIKLPSSNIKTNHMYDHLSEKYLKILPAVGCKAHLRE